MSDPTEQVQQEESGGRLVVLSSRIGLTHDTFYHIVIQIPGRVTGIKITTFSLIRHICNKSEVSRVSL